MRLLQWQLLNGSRRFADAEQRLMLVARLAPNDPDVLFQLGIARAYLGKREEALAAFRQALR